MNYECLVFTRSSSFIDEYIASQEIQNIIRGKGTAKDRHNTQVVVKMLHFSTLFEQDLNGNLATLGDFIEVLEQTTSIILNTELVRILVNHFYEQNLVRIIWICFIPYVIYFVAAILYFSYYMISYEYQEPEKQKTALPICSLGLTIAGILYFSVIFSNISMTLFTLSSRPATYA